MNGQLAAKEDRLMGKRLPYHQTECDTQTSETQLRHDLSEFVAAVEHNQLLAIHTIDREGIVRLWNRGSAELYEVPAHEALGKRLHELMQLEDPDKAFDATMAQIWNSGQPGLPRDWQITTASGRKIWVYSTFIPIHWACEVRLVMRIDIDITHRKHDEQSLFSSGDNFRTLFEKSSDAIMLVKDGQYVDVNPAALRLFGYQEKSDMLGLTVQDISPPTQSDGMSSYEKAQQLNQLARQYGNQRIEWVYVNSQNQPFWTEKLLTAIPVGKEMHLYVVIHDISARKEAEQSLWLAAQVYEHSKEGILITDQNQQIISVNKAFSDITGYGPQEVIGRNPHMMCSGLHDAAFYEQVWSDILHHDHWEGEIWDRHRDGHIYPLWQSITVVRDGSNEITNYFSIFSDITERKQVEDALHESEQRFRLAFETAAIGMALVGLDGQWLKVNKSLCKIIGYTEQELLSMRFQNITHPDDLENDLAHVHRLLNGEISYYRMEKRYFHKDGHIVWVLLSVSLVRDAQDKPIHFVSQLTDITELKEAESHTRYMAEHDFLTGLPSRALLLDRLGQAIAAARRNGSQLAVLFIDLDRFKNVNDSMGHSIGDKLLQQVAERLNRVIRGVDTVSRQGGDEFVIILADISNIAQLARIADNVMNEIALPYQIDGHEFTLTSSIGISIYPEDGKDIDTLLKNADVAMYHAKGSGRNSYQFFSKEMNVRIIERLTLESTLKKAIERNEFVLVYQPEMDIATGQTIGAEALIRWQHPESGLLLPANFISVAEDCGLIVPIGDWVLRTACQQARAWASAGRPMVVAVNLSFAQFRQKSLLQSVSDALQFAGLEPQYLELEITESILIDEAETTLTTLNELRKMGIKLAIDDFGTGYSSLSYLKRFSIDKLKIDQSFIRDISTVPNETAIINAIIAMAKSLNLKVIAEGVETAEQFNFLQSHGCDEYQGYYSSQALAPGDFVQFRALH
jgi:diguanylate cyclase (GGDEF)-like protein/PAS domain S-box-containing protein